MQDALLKIHKCLIATSCISKNTLLFLLPHPPSMFAQSTKPRSRHDAAKVQQQLKRKMMKEPQGEGHRGVPGCFHCLWWRHLRAKVAAISPRALHEFYVHINIRKQVSTVYQYLRAKHIMRLIILGTVFTTVVQRLPAVIILQKHLLVSTYGLGWCIRNNWRYYVCIWITG